MFSAKTTKYLKLCHCKLWDLTVCKRTYSECADQQQKWKAQKKAQKKKEISVQWQVDKQKIIQIKFPPWIFFLQQIIMSKYIIY